MNAKELHGKTPEALRENLVALKKEAFNLRFQRASGQLENTARVRAIRRDIARIKTMLTERKLGKAAPSGARKGKAEAAPRLAKKAKTAKAKAKQETA